MPNTTLLSLPAEILIQIPDHLHHVHDLLALAATCRTFHSVASTISPRSLLRLASESPSIPLFQPSSLPLIAVTAASLSKWALQKPSHMASFRNALQTGMQGLLDLSKQHSGLTLARIRALHSFRVRTATPFIDFMNRCAGAQSPYIHEGFATIKNPTSTFFHLVIYGELFGRDAFDAFIDHASLPAGSLKTACIPVDVRLDFVKYCVPDWACYECQNNAWTSGPYPNPLRACLQVGPYQELCLERYQRDLELLLRSEGWSEAWKQALMMVDDLVKGHPQQKWLRPFLVNCAICRGFEGLELMRLDMTDECKTRLEKTFKQVCRLERLPKEFSCGKVETFEFASLQEDLAICTSGY